MKFAPLDRLERNAKRLGEVVSVLAKYGLADWLKPFQYAWIQDRLRSVDGQRISLLEWSERVRLALTELGTTFIKLGQVLSTRPDLVGSELAGELSKLQDDTPADSAETVAEVIQSELGDAPEALFAEFDPSAMASASIAQVHRAKLRTGEDVAVKVEHAHIEKRIQTDLEILGGLAELAERHVPAARLYRPMETVRQFRRSLMRELDFGVERQNMEEFIRHFAEDDTVRFPRPYATYSGRRVLTMDYLEGIRGSELKRKDPGARLEGVDRNAFARRGANMYLEMIFRDSFYHADPHPGNWMWLPDGVVGVMDCGMTGRIDEDLREEIEALLMATVERDAARMTEVVLRLGSAPADCPRDKLRADLEEFVADHVNRPLANLDLSAALTHLVEIIHRYGIALPPNLALLLRTLVVLEGTSRLLSPEFSLVGLIRPFYFKLLRRRMSPGRLWTKFYRAYRDWDRLLEMLPRELADMLARMREGTLRVHLDHRHLDPVINRLVLGVMTAAVFLGSSLLWSMKAPPLVQDISIFGAAGYLLSLHMGWRLFRAVKKSGDIRSKD